MRGERKNARSASACNSCPRHPAVKVSSPAELRESSKATSASWRPVSSKLAIWNGPSTVPKSGMMTCQSRMVPLKT